MKKHIGLISDVVCISLFVGLSIYFVVEAVIGKLIPLKYILIAVSILLFLFILLLCTFKSKKLGWTIFRRVILGFLSIVLILGAVLQGQIRSAFNQVGDGTKSKDVMYVVTRKDAAYHAIDDIHSLGYVDHTSKLVLYSLQQLETYSFKTTAYESQEDKFNALDNSEVDAVLMTEQDQNLAQSAENSEYNQKYKVIHTIEMERTSEKEVADIDITKKPFVVYLSGMDSMGKPNYNSRCDVNMLLMVDPIHHHVEMISINRDTYVPNPALRDEPDKLTHLGWNGSESTAEVMERIFGIKVDYTAKVTFESLIKLIDTIGGIDVDVKLTFTEQDENRSFASKDLIHLEKGYQHINGKEALAYARHRKTAGWDVAGREQAQRDIIAAVVNKVLSVEGALKVGDMLNVAASYVSTNMPMDKAKAFIMNAIDTGATWSFGSSTVDSKFEPQIPCASYGPNGYHLNSVLLAESDIQKVYNLYLNMNTEAKFNEFEFDLANMEKFTKPMEMDPHVITIENYNSVVPTYFPEYYVNLYE